jgi:hypothetical protein
MQNSNFALVAQRNIGPWERTTLMWINYVLTKMVLALAQGDKPGHDVERVCRYNPR